MRARDGQLAPQVLLIGPTAKKRGSIVVAMPGSFKMLRSSNKRPGQLRALDRIKDWTRARFKLPEDAAVMVTEVACGLPGCPPLETVVAFWTGTDTRHHFKVFKPVENVVPDDLPPAWLRNALIAVEGEGLECC
jgi:hypothetical protein